MSRKWILPLLCSALYADQIISFDAGEHTSVSSYDFALKQLRAKHKDYDAGYYIDARSGKIIRSTRTSALPVQKHPANNVPSVTKSTPSTATQKATQKPKPKAKKRVMYKGDRILYPVEMEVETIDLK